MKPLTRWLSILFVLALALLGIAAARGGPARAAAPDAGAPGDLDTTFDPGSGANNEVYALALQPDGKILIGGWFTTYNGVARVRIARVNADGSLDTTFNPGSGADEMVRAIAIQPDGKILIGGWFGSYNNGGGGRGVARANADGSVDTTFDPDYGLNGDVYALALQPDGKILVGGDFTKYGSSGGITRNRVARLNADGSLDLTFDPITGANGRVWAIAIQPDGKILIAGEFTLYGTTRDNYIVRLNADGSQDTTFDQTGTGLGTHVYALLLQSDGKILVTGQFAAYNGISRNYIARLNADGTLDMAFDPGSGLGPSAANPYAYALALQQDGKILLGGQFTTYNGIARNFFARVNSDGSLDTTFDPGVSINLAPPWALAFQSDGRLLIGGRFATYQGVARNRIARVYGYTPPPSLSKTVTPTAAGPRDPVTYTLQLANPTGATLTGIVITDTLPAEILYPQVSSNVAITPRTGTRYVWDVADLAPGASALITITGQVSAAAAQMEIANTARFSSSGGGGQASATLTLPGVSVTRSGGGVGQVTSAPAGIACGRACSRPFAVGTVVTLTATPSAGSVFCGWSGACSGSGACAVTITTTHAVTARFGWGDCSGDGSISAVRSGDWANPTTWSAGRVPNASDIVAIGAPYTITAPATPVQVAKLYQNGVLQSARGSALRLYAMQINNTGIIRGQDGSPTAGATCGAPGSDVILGGGALVNSGTIQGGAGSGETCCAGGGGSVTLSFDTVDNSGLIAGGAGGKTGTLAGGACCANPAPGKGGKVLIRAGDRLLGLRNSGDIRGGAGGDQALCPGAYSGGCGGSVEAAAQPLRVRKTEGKPIPNIFGGAAGLYSTGAAGSCQGAIPAITRWDPSDIDINEAYLAADDIVIFGGTNWTMALTDTVTGAITATRGITLAVGTGGVIDLRGSQSNAFTAGERFFIASDSILLDGGKTLANIVNAPVIEQVGARILGAIAVSAPGFVRGLRGQALDIPVELVNNSPVAFTYDLATTGGSGLPASVTIGPVSSTVVTLSVNAPALGGEAAYTVTATAQASPFQSDQAVIRVYAPPATGTSLLNQTFLAGVYYPFAGTLGCGGVTFAADWAGQLTVTMGESTPAGSAFLPRAYTIAVDSAAPNATLTLCYAESDVEGAGIYSDVPLSLFKNGAGVSLLNHLLAQPAGTYTPLPGGRAQDASTVIGAGSLPGVFYLGETPQDYGDLPDAPYATLKASDGARHAVASGAPYLGALAPTTETDGQPAPGADADGAEDGVARVSGKNQTGGRWSNGAVSSGGGGAVQVVINGAAACLGAHFDFDGTGTLYLTPLRNSDGAEVAQPLAVGTHTLYFDVPAGTFPGAGVKVPIYARFRAASPAGGNCAGSAAYGAEGLAPDGEVEDYAWGSAPTAVTLRGLRAQALAQSWAGGGAALAGLVALGALVFLRRRRN